VNRVLVAGVGNVFFGDDGFGPAVVRALASDPPAGATVKDFGIRGMHLAYELLDGYERAILIDAAPRGEAPGTLFLMELDPQERGGTPDAHSMDLLNVFAFMRVLGGSAPQMTLVGCEPGATDEEMGLSEAVERAIEPALTVVRRLVDESLAAPPRRQGEEIAWSEV
jgi:hydrogenase maturation protease